MNILEKILKIFFHKEDVGEIVENKLVSDVKLEESNDLLKKDLEKLKEFENKIAQSGQNRSEINLDNAEKKVPEYFDGLSIKNPFIGE